MKLIDYTYIQSDKDLEGACAALESASRLAVDTEFVGEKYYYPKLEIVQLSDGETIYLVDAPAITNWQPLKRLLGNENALKIFHAGSQDLPILHRAIGARPLPMFDTQIAASLLGYGAQISLGNLVKEIQGIRMSSKQSTSDWSQRPLSDAQLAYAASDVLHLHALQEDLQNRLEKAGRSDWFADEQSLRLEDAFDEESEDPKTLYRRVKDWMSLGRQELAVLRDLAIWREETARQKNVPRRSVLRDEALVELSRFQPSNREQAKKIRRVNPGHLLRYFDDAQKVIERAQSVPEEDWPKKPAPDRPDIPTGLLEVCQALLRTQAERCAVASSVLATTSDIQRLIANRAWEDRDARLALLRGWRREVAGQHIVDLLEGRLSVRVGPKAELLFEENGEG